MHLAQHAPGLVGLGNGLRHDAMQLTRPSTPVEVVSRTVSVPAAAGDSDSLYQARVLLSWALLLQRDRGEDSKVDQFTWGCKAVGGAETTERLSLSALGLGLSRTGTDTVSTCLEKVKESTGGLCPQQQLESLFFNDEPQGSISQKEGSGSDPTQWTFQLRVTREDGGVLTLCGLRHGNSPLTERQAIDKLDTFTELLTIIIQHPESPIRDLLDPLPRDLDQIWGWNAVVPPTIDRTMHDIISEQAAAHPDKVALSSWDGQWTYAELESLSTRLAHCLCSRGVRVGTIVPLCFEKSRWTIIALLAVMKAGGAFALTDPTSQPEGRLRAMVEQTGARLLVASEAQSDLARRLVPINDGGVVVTVSESLLESLPSDTPASSSLPAIPATTSPLYIQFTSGSTGKPKGVVVSHANYTSGALPRASAVGYTSSSRVFEFASYAFDVSIDCMLCTLAAGGTICIPSDADRMNDLGGAIRASAANMAHMTPSVARVLDPAVLAGLDVLGLGGEAVSAADAAAWSQGRTSVVIAYGPSECTVGCTVNNTFANKNREGRKVFTTGNIGRGVGAVGWIADPEDHDRLVPVGSVGELLIEGPVVGLGYLGEPEKTAEVFIEDPAWLVAGYGVVPGRRGRLYKTGDLVRYDADGSGDFVFVGRKDAQVKLRGQRVELVEIEHHLRRRLPAGVKLAAEVIKPSGGQPTLVAFVAEPTANQARLHADDEPSEDPQEEHSGFSEEIAKALTGIDEVLGAELPRYMVPAAYIPLREMPSLPSAKIDRKRLRAIGAAMTREQLTISSRRNNKRMESGGQPATETERALQRVWKTLLGDHVDNISVLDSFFSLGGDSLRAMKLVPAARAEGILLTVADVFRYPVLRDMAVVARTVRTDKQQHTGDTTPDVVPPFSLLPGGWPTEEARADASRHCDVNPADVEDVYPCTPLQEALMALSAKVKEAYVAQRVLKMESLDAAERLQAAFATIAADSAILRTRIIQVPQRGLVQVVVKEPLIWRSAASLAEYLAQDRDEPMELGKPLVRYAMIREGGVAHFVLTMHHALYDGWSMPLVVDRVNQAYQGRPPRRPAAEFKHFIHYLNRTLDRAACDAYWREQLAGATGQQFPRLPFEGYQTQADSLLEVDISLEGRRLPTCSNATVTLATVVRAAWALVASQYCGGNRDIVFGETLTGRNAPIVGCEEIEGPMITTVPIRIRIDRDATVEEYLQTIAEQAVAQIPYEHAGLQHIRRLSDDALQACELRTGFVLHPAAAAAAAGDDVAAAATDGETTTPANGLVPAGDAEAAREALKFNTYALMLVCSLSADGFFVMASFDSRTVDRDTMSRVLEQLRIVVHQLCESDGKNVRVGQVQCLTETERRELRMLSKSPLDVGGPCLAQLGLAEDEIEGVWIVDAADYQRLLPLGAVGELVVASRKELGSPAVAIVDSPEWLSGESEGSNGTERKARLYRTRLLATFGTVSGKPTLQILQSMTDLPKQNATTKRTPAAKETQAVTATSTKQKTLRRIWSRLLNTDENSIYLGDSFFTLGGDSITAMKLVAEARQQGMQLSVAQVFANRTLYEMANVMQPSLAVSSQLGPSESPAGSEYKPFSLLPSSLTQCVQRELEIESCKIVDILPTRPLQEIAVRGTVELPRFSIRYELIHFDGMVDKTRLFRACQELVARNEILRTVFVRVDGICYSVVLDDSFIAPVVEYEVDDASSFAGEVSHLDSKTRMPYGSSFVKWFFITDGTKCTLVFRLSHAQYDEMCLPIFLKQLHGLYEGSPNIPPSYPFSAFVNHVCREGIPAAVPYWRTLLAGSPGITALRLSTPITDRRHFAVHRTVDISARTRDVTVATFPSAAWALTLARLTGSADVVFGEVASGRSIDVPGIPDANAIAGPCWQYVPTRVRFGGGGGTPATGHDLLAALQHQHMATSSHDCMGLDEIVRCCTDWDPEAEGLGWFDSVVHQDVAHVEGLEFKERGGGGGGDMKARMETVYPYEEPLREWKIQAFYHGESETLTLEVVTFQSWREHAVEVLDKLVLSMEQLVERPWEELGVV
ncbi:Nonribosomal peptide synthetase 4 [Achaetomium macrosporum]|uniref:Brevianamide F synthase n=1 Tax=Achaetomium macrosporum TaxID=79813 RepID=A0AAN7C368_9PEZI|nr:Nonribosomal peptide synthetase 4 [Achaetomium macrosporum]